MSANDRYVGYAMLAFCVTIIDGVLRRPRPATEGPLAALVALVALRGLPPWKRVWPPLPRETRRGWAGGRAARPCSEH